MMPNTKTTVQPALNVRATIMAWIFPGLGHMNLGQCRKGRFICFGVLFLVVMGVLVGGIDAVDHKNDGLWFIAQVFCGPVVIAIDMATQFIIVEAPIEKRATLVGLSHVNEIGTLFIAMAGLMNFVVILDAMRTTRSVDLERRAKGTDS